MPRTQTDEVGAAAAADAPQRADSLLAMEHENDKAALAFRKQVAAYISKNADRTIINRLAITDGKDQTLFELSKHADGRVVFYESYGQVKNFPRSYRLKRSGNPLDRDNEDAEAEGDAVTEERRREAEWEKEERRRAEAMGAKEERARARRAAAKTGAGKRQKQARSASGPATPAVRAERQASVEPARRSSRVADARRRSAGVAGEGRVPDIREDEQEHHVGDFTAGLGRGQDDLASLLNGLQGCEIRSEIGSNSTVIIDRDEVETVVA